LGIYFWLNKKRLTQASKAWMVFSSLFFYSWWNVIYLPIMLGSILFNFAVGSTITHINGTLSSKKRISSKTMLIFGIIANVLLLAYFKYMDFFIVNLNAMVGTHLDLIHIVLPLGISFFTFTQIAYLVDAYRDEVKEMDYLNYTLFVTFFPHVLAGPILHHKEMMPQFDAVRNKVFNSKNLAAGMYLFAIGLFKKVVIADTFVVWVSYGYGSADSLTFITAWTTSLAYTFQLYFDFSGYTDMALAVALLFNIKLPINFNSPYKALNIQDFWRRWHISLSSWFKDYLYIPLGGSKGGKWMQVRNTFIIFIVSGFWHGANWTFIAWGFLNALYFLPLLLTNNNRNNISIVAENAALPNVKEIFQMGVTFFITMIAWVFFRSENISQALSICGEIFSTTLFSMPSQRPLFMFLAIGFFFLLEWMGRRNRFALETLLLQKPRVLRWGFYYGLMIAILLFAGKEQTFIYFQF
jgi:D-alanyl-lipoteichoic acid acyltransferase DltB (MBOAT superfamily)